MKKVTIKRVHLENYKAIGDITVDFGKTTEIRGKNAVGKSTVSGAILEVLTGKLPNGSEAVDEILRPVVNGAKVDRVPIVRELTVDVDGQEYVIRKETVQKWTRHKGDFEETFSGNENHYSVDGFEFREKDYIAWLNEHVCNTDKLLYCMNPAIFLNRMEKSTADARIALEMASGFSLENFIAENPMYSDIEKITSGQPVEKAIKKYRADLNKQKKDLTASQNNLAYEQNRKIDELPVDDVEDIKNQIAETQVSLNLVTARNEKHKEIEVKLDMLKKQLATEEQRFNSEVHAKMDSFYKATLDCRDAIQSNERMLDSEERNFEHMKDSVKNFELQRNTAEENLKTEENRKPGEDQFVCPSCGQMLPIDKVAEANEKFEEEKANNIKAYKASVEFVTDMIKQSKKKLEEMLKNIDGYKAKKESLKKDFEGNVNAYNQLKNMPYPVPEGIAKLRAEIEKLEDAKKSVAGYDGEIEVDQKHIRELNEILTKAEANKRTNEAFKQNHIDSVNHLMNEVKQNAQACATLEGIIDKLMMFGRQKNEKLAELVNPYFSYLHFSFVGYTQDGSPYDDCKIVSRFDGIGYKETNHGYRLLTEMDLVSGLQKLNGVELPIICDDTESLDAERIPKFDNQLILIRRTDDNGIMVKEI